MMKAFIENEIESALSVYRIKPGRISADYNIEQAAIQSYQGREIFELIQNADDEMRLLKDFSQCNIRISYSDGYLSISNNGEPFTERGVQSLMLAHDSGKMDISHKTPVIGNKGTGFRAVLSWAERIVIHSQDLHIAFSSQHSNEVLKSLPLEKRGNRVAATLAFPEWIDTSDHQAYTTEIGLQIKSENTVKERIIQQLVRLDGTILLFLNYARSITIDIEKNEVEYRRVDNKNETIIEKYENGTKIESTTWILREEHNEIEGKYYSVAVAYRKDGKAPERNTLYSYLPTEVILPLPLLMHATLELDGTRNHIVRNSNTNKEVLSKAANLLIATVCEKASRRKKSSYDELRMIIPQSDIVNSELTQYSFWETLDALVKKAAILPTVNDKYICADDDPVFYRTPVSLHLSGEMFDELLKCESDTRVVDYIETHSLTTTYTAEYFSSAVNKWAKSRKYSEQTVNENCLLIKSILDGVSEEDYLSLNLIYCMDKKLTTDTNSAYMDSGLSHVALPSFTKMRLIDPMMQTQLLNLFDNDEIYMINHLVKFNLRTLNINEVISKMQRTIDQMIKRNDYQKAQVFIRESVRWFVENADELDERKSHYSVYMLTKEGQIAKSDSLYYGADYNNSLIEKLLDGFDQDIFVEYNPLLVEEFGLDRVTNLFHKIGVAGRPRDLSVEMKLYEKSGFNDFFWEKIKYPLQFDKYILRKDTSWKQFCGSFHTFEHLDWILSNSSTEAIIEWILDDDSLRRNLQSKKDPRSFAAVKFDSFANPRSLNSKEIPSYIAWRFEQIGWVTVDGKRYRLSDCILESLPASLSDVLVCPDFASYISLKHEKRRSLRREYERLFIDIGVCENYGDLPSHKLYELLKELGEKRIDPKETRTIYTKIYDSYNESNISQTEKDQFRENGLVLCQDGQYYCPKESYYLDRRAFCKVIRDRFHLISLSSRLSSAKICGLFGVDQLRVQGTLRGEPEIHFNNIMFQSNLENYKICVCCYRYGKNRNKEAEEIGKLKKLKIVLCSKITAGLNGEEIHLEPFDYVPSNDLVYYLCVPTNIQSSNDLYSHLMGDAVSGIICDVLNLFEERTSFRDLYMKPIQDRLYAVKDEVEEDDIFERVSRELGSFESIREEFSSILSALTSVSDDSLLKYIEKIDFDDFSSDSNMSVIIDIFRDNNLDVDEYNKRSILADINLIGYFQRRCEEYKRDLYDTYRLSTYNQLINESVEEKTKLIDMWYSYEDTVVPVYNSVFFDPEEAVKKLFGIGEYIANIEELNLKYQQSLTRFKEHTENKDFFEQFVNSNEITSLLYYDEIDELILRYDKFVAAKTQDVDVPSEKKQISFTPLTAIRGIVEPQDIASATKRIKRVGFSKEGTRKKEKNLERIGYTGEKRVYEWLLLRCDNVKWMSENAKKAGVNPTGSAEYGYDISFIQGGNEYFVDVKSSSSGGGEIVFFLSSHELDFALKHSENYRIYYVENADSEAAKLIILDDVIKDGALNNLSYTIVQKTEYKLCGVVRSVSSID